MAFLRGLWAARPAGRIRLSPWLRQLVQVHHLTAEVAPRCSPSTRTSRSSARLPRASIHTQAHRPAAPRLGAYGRSSLARCPAPTSFARHEVGLGRSRQFSSSAPAKAVDLIQNAPLLLRAALDALECPSKEVSSRAACWPRLCVTEDGRIALTARVAHYASAPAPAAVAPSPSVVSCSSSASTSDLFPIEAAACAQAEAQMELLLPAQPSQMPTFPFELESGGDTDRVLSAAFMHVLQRQGSYMQRHLKRLQSLLHLLEQHKQLGRVQLASVRSDNNDDGSLSSVPGPERQVFRIGVKSWTESDLRQALGLQPDDTPPWQSLVDWRRVHSGDEDGDAASLTSSEEEEGIEGLSASTEQAMDFVFPSAHQSATYGRTTVDDDDCGLDYDKCDDWSSSSEGRTASSLLSDFCLGPGSLLQELDELQSPRFRSAPLPLEA